MIEIDWQFSDQSCDISYLFNQSKINTNNLCSTIENKIDFSFLYKISNSSSEYCADFEFYDSDLVTSKNIKK